MRTRSRFILAVGLLLSILGAGATAEAQYYYPPPYPPPPPRVYYRRPFNPYARRHFYLGIGGVIAPVLAQSGPRSILGPGGGFELTAGGRFNRWVGLEFNWMPTFHKDGPYLIGVRGETLGLEAFTVDLKIFLVHGPVQPFFTVGGGAYAMSDNFSPFASGGGYEIGGGIDFWLSPWVSLGVKAQYRGVALFDYDLNNDNTYLSLFTGSFNLTGHF